MPFVSVIIPNYNHEVYLSQRIESVLNQTYSDFEIIILDDCSTDNSRFIIEKYRYHEKITSIIYNEVNSGSTFRQWQKGIDMAAGEWIWIAESDDWCEKIFLDSLLSPIISNNNIVLSYCSSLVISEKRVLSVSRYNNFEMLHDSVSFIKLLSKNNLISNASSAIFKKDTFGKISPDFLNFKFCGDWVFWIEISKYGFIYESGKVLNYFRKHSNDLSGKVYKSGLYYEEYLNVLDYFKKNNFVDRKAERGKLINKYVDLSKKVENKKNKFTLRLKYFKALGLINFLYGYMLFSYNKIYRIFKLLG